MIRRKRRSPRAALVLTLGLMLAAGCNRRQVRSDDRVIEGGDAQRGRTDIAAYGCGSCHQIPGIRDANGMVGPSLEHWAERRVIAGVVPNDPPRLITWLTVPQSIQPGSAMPNMGVSDGQARDMATYLYTLH